MWELSRVAKTSATNSCYVCVNGPCNKEGKMPLTRTGRSCASNSARRGPVAATASSMIGLMKSWRA
jgi:hypothetical protein